MYVFPGILAANAVSLLLAHVWYYSYYEIARNDIAMVTTVISFPTEIVIFTAHACSSCDRRDRHVFLNNLLFTIMKGP